MFRKHPGLLTLPAGSEGLFLQDAELHRRLVRDLDRLYEAWGYTQVHTPMVDYADSYAEAAGIGVPDHTYRLVDREGQVMNLRSDITLFLVKQIHTLLRKAELPLRLCYSDSILRYQDSADIGKNEYFQTGIELLGKNGRDGDLEVLALFAEALETIGVPDPVVHIGHRQVFDILYPKLDPDSAAACRRAIAYRRWRELPEPQSGAKPDPSSVFGLILEPESESAGYLAAALPEELAQVAADLEDRVETLRRLFPAVRFRIDLSELGSQAYHSGLVFSAYVDGLDSAIAAGGRYDGLLLQTGREISAVGFSIMLSKLIAALGSFLNQDEQAADEEALGTGKFETRYIQARGLRASGKRVRL